MFEFWENMSLIFWKKLLRPGLMRTIISSFIYTPFSYTKHLQENKSPPFLKWSNASRTLLLVCIDHELTFIWGNRSIIYDGSTFGHCPIIQRMITFGLRSINVLLWPWDAAGQAKIVRGIWKIKKSPCRDLSAAPPWIPWMLKYELWIIVLRLLQWIQLIVWTSTRW